jgi:phage terminase large subunit GpA-like protein
MKTLIKLDEADIEEILTEYINKKYKTFMDIEISYPEVCVGYGTDEHLETQISVLVTLD